METKEIKFQKTHLKEIGSTNTYLQESDKDRLLPEGTIVYCDIQRSGRGQRGNSWESEYGKNLTFSTVFYPQTIAPASQFILSMAVASAIRTALAHYVHADCLQIKWPNDIYWKDKKIVGILIENDLTGSQISQSIVGIGININQEEFHSSAPNPVSLRQITQKETDRMEVLNSVLEHIINLYSRIENRETDIITKIQEYYLKAQYRKEGYHPYCDAKGEFTAKLIRVEPDGHLILKDKNGSLRKYTFKEVKYIL